MKMQPCKQIVYLIWDRESIIQWFPRFWTKVELSTTHSQMAAIDIDSSSMIKRIQNYLTIHMITILFWPIHLEPQPTPGAPRLDSITLCLRHHQNHFWEKQHCQLELIASIGQLNDFHSLPQKSCISLEPGHFYPVLQMTRVRIGFMSWVFAEWTRLF